MADIDEDCSCEICFETYDLKDPKKLPKLTSCCSHTFCLSCLIDIYTRNNNTFKCPYCRKSTKKHPKEYKTNSKIFSRFLMCCHCEDRVHQNKLFLCLDNGDMEIRCDNCKDNNDYQLKEYLPALLNELKIFYEYNKINKNFDIILFLKDKIKKQIEKYIEDIIKEMTNLMTKKIINQIKVETNYDLEKEKKEFDKKLQKVDFDYKYLNEFYNNEPTKIFDAKKILELLKFYDTNVDVLKKEMKKLAEIKYFIENKNIFTLSDSVDINKLCNYLLDNIEII